ncbi:hypothetical protein HKCCSP123_19460 [Rhodobacterales bacterium HKCCSP123]|nr:hypothetical protein [Rhodobacterales bacterium HKCCSP123]
MASAVTAAATPTEGLAVTMWNASPRLIREVPLLAAKPRTAIGILSGGDEHPNPYEHHDQTEEPDEKVPWLKICKGHDQPLGMLISPDGYAERAGSQKDSGQGYVCHKIQALNLITWRKRAHYLERG